METKIFIEWSEDLSMNLKEIDNQHKKLVDIINELYSTFFQGLAREKITETLNALTKYTEYHFNTEENYFEMFNYKFTDDHVVEHTFFIEKLRDFNKQLQVGSNTLPYEVLNFLRDWITNHIKRTDRKYMRIFSENGVK